MNEEWDEHYKQLTWTIWHVRDLGTNDKITLNWLIKRRGLCESGRDSSGSG